MLKFMMWLVILFAASSALVSLTDLSGPLQDLIEQYFLALILLAVLPMFMSGQR